MRLKSAALVISNKTDLKAQSKLQSTKEHIISTPTWSSSTTAEHITKHAEGLIHKEYSLRQNYFSVRKSPFEWCIVAKTSHGVGLEEKPDGANITRFKRLRKVRLFCDGNSYSMSCSCCMPKTHGLPCRHLLYLLGEPKLTMVHVIYLNQYYVKYGVDPKYTSKFDEQRNKHLGHIVIPSEDALELLSYSGSYPACSNSNEYDEIMKLEMLDRPFVTTRMFTGSEHLQSTQMFVSYLLSPKTTTLHKSITSSDVMESFDEGDVHIDESECTVAMSSAARKRKYMEKLRMLNKEMMTTFCGDEEMEQWSIAEVEKLLHRGKEILDKRFQSNTILISSNHPQEDSRKAKRLKAKYEHYQKNRR